MTSLDGVTALLIGSLALAAGAAALLVGFADPVGTTLIVGAIVATGALLIGYGIGSGATDGLPGERRGYAIAALALLPVAVALRAGLGGQFGAVVFAFVVAVAAGLSGIGITRPTR
jgi:hypothetical protein